MNKNIFLTLIIVVHICNLYSSQSGMTEQEIINYATNTPLKNIFEQKYSDIKQTKPIIDDLYENKIAMNILELRIKSDPVGVKHALENTEKSICNMNNNACNAKSNRATKLKDLYDTLLDIAAQSGIFSADGISNNNDSNTSSMPPLEPLSNTDSTTSSQNDQQTILYHNFLMQHPYVLASALTSACIGIYYLYHYQYIPTNQEAIDNK